VYGEREQDTYVRAIFTLSKTLVSAIEYFPDDIGVSTNPITKTNSYFFNSAPQVEIRLPSLFSYNPTKPSSRVNNDTLRI
jgi:hypothetical protein